VNRSRGNRFAAGGVGTESGVKETSSDDVGFCLGIPFYMGEGNEKRV
jgi:hypothetical protein